MFRARPGVRGGGSPGDLRRPLLVLPTGRGGRGRARRAATYLARTRVSLQTPETHAFSSLSKYDSRYFRLKR